MMNFALLLTFIAEKNDSAKLEKHCTKCEINTTFQVLSSTRECNSRTRRFISPVSTIGEGVHSGAFNEVLLHTEIICSILFERELSHFEWLMPSVSSLYGSN